MEMYLSASRWIERNSSGNRLWIGCIFVFSFLVVLPIAVWGIPENYDLLQHMRFARAYYAEMQDLGLSPSWAAEDNKGFGSVGVRFYPPLAYIVAAATQFLTKSWFDTLWINILLWMFVGSVGVYLWTKDWITAPYAAMAAILYAVVPYHLFQVYQAFLLAEFAASAILPYCFLFAGRIVHRGGLVNMLSFAAAFGFLVLSHIPSTIIATIALAVYTLLIIDWRRFVGISLNFLGAFALSLAATSFHWLRLVTELDWVQHNSPKFYNAFGFYNFKTHLFPMFVGVNERYWTGLFLMFDITISLTAFLFIPLTVALLLHYRDRTVGKLSRSLIALGITGSLALFMTTWGSLSLWNWFSFLQKVQFPWRWLAVASLAGAILFVACVHEILKQWPTFQRPVFYGAVIILFAIFVFNVSQQILPSAPLSREVFAAELAAIDSKEVCSCWWPTWAKDEALRRQEKVFAGSRSVDISDWGDQERRFTLEAGSAATARIATFYYPHWRAEVDGVSVPVEKAEDGEIAVTIPAERSEVRIYFEEPSMLLTARWLSLAAWIVLLGALAAKLYRARTAPVPKVEPVYV